jgi:O-antigen/teichoic acid export membrane protein
MARNLGRARSWRIASTAAQVALGSCVVLGGRFLAFLLAARFLEASEFGVFAIVQSLAALVERLFNVQSWQLLTKRLAQISTSSNTDSRNSVIGAAISADLIGSGLALCTTWSFLQVFGARFGIGDSAMLAAQVYCAIVFFNAHGAWAGILRANGLYGSYAIYQSIAGCMVLSLVAVTGWSQGNVTAPSLLYAWLVGELSGYLFLTTAAMRALQQRGVPLRSLISSLQDLWTELRAGAGFLLSITFAGSLRMVTREGDVLLVGTVLGSPAAGAYKIGRNLAMLPLLLTDSLYFLAYPRFSVLFARDDIQGVRRLIRQGCLLGTIVGLVAVALAVLVGKQFLELISITDPLVFRTMCICIVSTALATATFPFAPAMVASGNHRHQVIALLISTVAFLIVALAAMKPLGIAGAALSSIIFYLTWIAAVTPRLIQRGLLYDNNR